MSSRTTFAAAAGAAPSSGQQRRRAARGRPPAGKNLTSDLRTGGRLDRRIVRPYGKKSIDLWPPTVALAQRAARSRGQARRAGPRAGAAPYGGVAGVAS